ncbi:selenocysteine-specific translation elongation factor [Methanococcus aeolicus]|uniref:selenocysteine-specific translation elongation factor n=1 Tax=Methanococcus aeolicus TaxID=42879 RepID=UPI0021C7ABE0|nr:selenocysteine-specific translation elongation factor [Methanococcus aeolicus]UXM84361.1 selenocysteine-specific translation elongation factor [Methanococcus aeolicus]
MKNINLGIFGHIDHGKTSLARVLTEIASTSSLDKLPESKKRGITIDIGFSSFNMPDYIITLVDAPGHADLIKAVVSAADIIDLAILVVDAKEGPKTQTGEHLLILDYFNIPTIAVITKIDLATEEEIKRTKSIVSAVLNSTENLKDSQIIEISAKENKNIDNLKNTIHKTLNSLNITRSSDEYFKMPIDHAFPIKGIGTVITGTILKGKVSVGQDDLKIMPINVNNIKVKSIQRFKKEEKEAMMGDRVGMALHGVDAKQIYRGCILTSSNSKLEIVDKIVAKIKMSDIFRYNIKPKMKVHLNVGMLIVPAIVVPFKKIKFKGKEENIILKEIQKGDECYCSFELDEKVMAEIGDNILITRLDLPPTTLRICGRGEIVEFKSMKDLNIKKEVIRTGNIKIDKNRVFIEGLANSKSSAEKLIGEVVELPDKNITGKLKNTFGTKGYLTADFDGEVSNKDKVILNRLRRWG